MQAGVSWEGVVWKTEDVHRFEFEWLELRFNARLFLQLLAAVAPVLAIVIMLVTAPSAYAHGTSCSATAYTPRNLSGGDIQAIADYRCGASGYSHYSLMRIYKAINNYPDSLVAGSSLRTTSASWRDGAAGSAKGCGVYYTDARIRYHDYDTSGNYYRC